jgi:ribosome-binding protein aMBF1 (putative translation factor)
LPTKLAEELKVKETQVEATEQAEIQEQLDALSSLEVEGL